jgi:hypothetical protein
MTRREFLASAVSARAAAAPEAERARREREWDEAHDKRGIRHAPQLQLDEDEALLRIPRDYPEPREFDVARTPPRVHFGLIQGLEPEYLSEISTPRSQGVWGGWGSVRRGPDGCFYFSIGNHMSYDGGTAYIIRFDPKTLSHRIVVDTRKVFGWGRDDYADGKLHGDLDCAPNGDLWAMTYFGPVPKPEDWESRYRGGSLFRYNVFSGEIEKLGVVFEGESWPYHSWDFERHLFFAAGHLGHVLVYDTRERRLVYGGWPADGIRWCNRATLIDRTSGLIYSTDVSADHALRDRFVCYRRSNNRFRRLEARVPPNPVTGVSRALRAYTTRKGPDGAFWCFDMAGTFFKFHPEADRTELVGVNWGAAGKYTTNIAMSPKGRYLYYLPGADKRAFTYGTPVVQYDTAQGRKKVIAFLHDYYLEKYGYAATGTYGLELDAEGATLFFFMDGRFGSASADPGEARKPSLFLVEIPASERAE